MKTQKSIHILIVCLTTIMFFSACKKKSTEDATPVLPKAITDIDGNIYHSVTIGSQVWLVENLNTTKYRDGTVISNITDSAVWSTLSTGAYCDYKNNPSNSTTYGKLYNWYAVTNGKKIAPEGWHVATDSDWTKLTNFLGGDSIAGNKLKEAGFAHWGFQNTLADNSSGFTLLPGGIRTCFPGQYILLNIATNIWTSSEENGLGVCRYVYVDKGLVHRWGYSKTYGYSVRCIKD